MPPQQEMMRLRADHAKIGLLSADLRALLRAPVPPDDDVLARARKALSDALTFHLKCEDWVVYPSLLESDDPAIAAKAQAFRAETGALAVWLADHVQRWRLPATIAADWEGYCADTTSVLDILASCIEREEAELYPLAERRVLAGSPSVIAMDRAFTPFSPSIPSVGDWTGVAKGQTMDMTHEMQRLREEHEELGVLARRLRQMVDAADMVPMTDLDPVRLALRSLLIGHLKREDWVLYPALVASEDKHVADLAYDFETEMGGIAATFNDYSRKWMPQTIADDWAGYCDETRSILNILGTRMAREDRELYPLAANGGPDDAAASGSGQARAAG